MLMLFVAMFGVQEAFIVEEPDLHVHLLDHEHEHEHGMIRLN